LEGKELKSLTSLAAAVDKLASVLKGLKLGVEEVELLEARGRVLSRSIEAKIAHPPFDRSAVDGYAVRSSDTYSASLFNPVELRVVKEAQIKPGYASPVSTGEPLPEGADAVVMVEETTWRDGKIMVYRPVAVGANVSRRGEDFSAGDVVLEAGSVLDFRKIPVLSAAGYSRVEVLGKLRIGVVSIGSEVVEPTWVSGHLPRGRIMNSTSYVVLSYLGRYPFINTAYYGIAPDEYNIVEDIVLKALSVNDIVITTGGTGPGSSDLVYELVEKNGKWVFRGVAMRPGRPTSLSLIDGKPILHLSGFPLAAWTGLEGLFKPALTRALGLKGLETRVVYARVATRLPNQAGYTTFIRSRLKAVGGELVVEPFMLRGSGLLRSLSETDSYIRVEEGSEGFEEGEVIPVYLDYP
jgi:molybdopterin molybdotransferase